MATKPLSGRTICLIEIASPIGLLQRVDLPQAMDVSKGQIFNLIGDDVEILGLEALQAETIYDCEKLPDGTYAPKEVVMLILAKVADPA